MRRRWNGAILLACQSALNIDPGPFGVIGGVALELVPETGIDASLGYDLEARNDFRNHKVQLNLRFSF